MLGSSYDEWFCICTLAHPFLSCSGKFSVVKLVKDKKTGKEYAVKMITKKISENEEVMKEIEVMKAVSEHPGVIHLKEVYEDDENFNLVIELFVRFRSAALFGPLLMFLFFVV